MYVWACIYLVYKTLSIPSKYPSYANFAHLSSLQESILDDYSLGTTDEMDLKRLIKEILRDKSHITSKIRQTLNFLKTSRKTVL